MMMQIRQCARACALATIGLSGLGVGVASAAEAPRNVIVIIGDGMGFEQVEGADLYFNYGPGETGGFNFQSFANLASMTHNNASNALTDSAASGTAIATGFKANNGVISVALPGDGSDRYTLLEHFRDQGKRTGLVTTSAMTDATPAAFGAHDPSRSNSSNIANDYFNQTRPNVLFGGGASGFTSAAASTAGYSVVTNRTQLNALNTGASNHVAGIFDSGEFDYAYDQSQGTTTFYDTNPFLDEMTGVALDVLDNDADGFFLMVENELTDSSGHLPNSDPNKTLRNAHEVNELAKATQSVLDWAAGRTDTLIIVTADHETGGLTVSGSPGSTPTYTWGGSNHTTTPVPVYATGPNADLVSGTIDNTNIPGIVLTDGPEPPTVTETFRQGVDGYASALDTHVRSNDGVTPTNGGATKLVVDAEDGGAVSQGLIKFDDLFGAAGGQVPAGVTVEWAMLTLYTGPDANDQSATTTSLYPMTATWDENSTWSSLAGGVTVGAETLARAEGLVTPAQLGNAVTFDVTATLQAWLDGTLDNNGWLLLANGTDGWRISSTEFATLTARPMLTVTYAVPEPGAAALTAGAMVALVRRRRRALTAAPNRLATISPGHIPARICQRIVN